MSRGEDRRRTPQPTGKTRMTLMLGALVVIVLFLGGLVFVAIGLWSWLGPRPDPVSTLADRGVQVTAQHCAGYDYQVSTRHRGRISSHEYDSVQVRFTAAGKPVTATLANLHHGVGVNSRTYTEIHSGHYRCPLQVTYDPKKPTSAMATADLAYYKGNAYRRTGEIEFGAGVLGVILAVAFWKVMQLYGRRARARATGSAAD